ncbi:hypothetical protein B0J11DRAFT_434876 [Dendryphion nanum]|uniref:N-acetyltransferase domain-containing protein n=1 Tax=Dendryphion nanum TaxID=256645 RepID=A0A9P9DTY4_9PLEO|nr:hypothetical protein B0J11DRAFT_434876 [Dendryphion nanum]
MKGSEVKTSGPNRTQSKPHWRNLTPNSIDSLMRVANTVHPDLPENREVFAQRIDVFPEGCLGLTDSDSGELCGYVISHPIQHRQPPALNSLLRECSLSTDQYYIHDLAILPKYRGLGLAEECLNRIFLIADGFPTTSLISVYGTSLFWGRYGFVPLDTDGSLKSKLIDYGDEAIYLERDNKSS